MMMKEKLGWSTKQLGEMRLMGYAYIKEGRWSEAITLFKALVAFDSQAKHDWQALGAVYLQKGQYPEALGATEQALALDPTDEPTRLNRAKALLVLGRLEEGLALTQELTEATQSFIAQTAEALLLAYNPA